VAIRIKRAYEPPAPSDGRRYLVDRLWPRGLSAERLQLTAWRKELAPSDELRRWYGHDPNRFAEFRMRYRLELEAQHPSLAAIAREGRDGTVTLVFGARDAERSNAAVLAERITEGSGRPGEAWARLPPPALGHARRAHHDVPDDPARPAPGHEVAPEIREMVRRLVEVEGDERLAEETAADRGRRGGRGARGRSSARGRGEASGFVFPRDMLGFSAVP
jgi:uncharacterized protein YeaO (DUF488 family)